jgi:DNA primase
MLFCEQKMLRGISVRKTNNQIARSGQIESATLERLRGLPMAEVAQALGIKISHGKAMCFNGHDTETPSFTISKTKSYWKCYGCQEYGDTISLVEKMLGLDFKAACSWLCENFRVEHGSVPATRLTALRSRSMQLKKPTTASAPASVADTQADPELYAWLVGRCGPVIDSRGTRYLEDHGIPLDVARLFGVVEMQDPIRAYRVLEKAWGAERIQKAGLSKHRRALLWSGYSLIFPFNDNNTSVSYVQVRCLESKQKFIGPVGVMKPIFNRGRLQLMRAQQVLHICEGIPDALALEGRGLAAIGILGATSFRTEWVDELLPFDLVGVPDGDSGGEQFRQSLVKAFHARSKSIRFVLPPKGMDACDVISKVVDA